MLPWRCVHMDNKKRLVSPKAGLLLLILFILFSVILFVFSTLFSSEGFTDAFNAMETVDAVAIPEKQNGLTIILDAGHGGEDPGAVVGDLKEKELNLNIVKKLQQLFSIGDYNIVLTRSEDVLLYNSGEEGSKKQYDLKNRVKVASSYEKPIFISIHMNKFYLESCKGAQVFHSDNEISKELAEGIQNSVRLLQTDNNRIEKNGASTMFLLERLNCPAVLIECGFLSNPQNAKELTNEEYANKLAFLIFKGILEWINENETDLCLR